jgi:hypothetical protein
MKSIKSAKIGVRYKSGVEFQQAYIDIILRLAGYRLSDLYISILAYVSYFGKLDKNVKQILAEKNNTSVQVISNGITRLRKIGVLQKNTVNQKLVPADKEAINLTLMLGVESKTETIADAK